MKLKGKAHVLGDFVNTDEHASDKYRPAGTRPETVQGELFRDLRPGFSESVAKGDFIVAGKGFGTVSARVDACMNIKAVGIDAVLASSFGMLFYRNAINSGLPCIECDTSRIADGDELVIDLEEGSVRDVSSGERLSFKPFPAAIAAIMAHGGLLEYIRRNKDYVGTTEPDATPDDTEAKR